MPQRHIYVARSHSCISERFEAFLASFGSSEDLVVSNYSSGRPINRDHVTGTDNTYETRRL